MCSSDLRFPRGSIPLKNLQATILLPNVPGQESSSLANSFVLARKAQLPFVGCESGDLEGAEVVKGLSGNFLNPILPRDGAYPLRACFPLYDGNLPLAPWPRMPQEAGEGMALLGRIFRLQGVLPGWLKERLEPGSLLLFWKKSFAGFHGSEPCELLPC